MLRGLSLNIATNTVYSAKPIGLTSEETAKVGEVSAGLDGFNECLRYGTAWVSLAMCRWNTMCDAGWLMRKTPRDGYATDPDTLISILRCLRILSLGKGMSILLVTRFINDIALL